MTYYSTQNGTNAPGNFGISNTSRPNIIQYVSNYTTGINSAGYVPQNASVRAISDVIVAMASPTFISNGQIIGMNNVADDGRVNSLDNTNSNSNYPVNSEQSIINNNESFAEYGNQSGAGQNINPY